MAGGQSECPGPSEMEKASVPTPPLLPHLPLRTVIYFAYDV